MTSARDDEVVLELSPQQQDQIVDASGVQLRTLRYSRTEAAGVAMLVEAVAAGHRSPASRNLISFELTPAQSAALHAGLGGDAPSRWIVDADHVRLRYHEDWAALAATPLGNRGVATPEGAACPADRLVVRLPVPTAGAEVFGTGRHAATQLAAELLEDYVRQGADVLDVGTGSGILAVYAVRLGAAHVRATDTEPAALEAARRAAVLNDLGDRIEVAPAGFSPDDAPHDLVVANILAGLLVDLMPDLAGSVRAGGTLLTSGVAASREADVIAAAAAQGCHHVESRTRDGWTASAFRR